MIRTVRPGSLLAAALIAAATPSARAQSVVQSIGTDLRDFGGDAVAVWLSPLHGRARDWGAFVGTIAAAAAVSPLDDDVDRYMVRRRYDWFYDRALSSVREGGAAFSGRYIVPVAAGAYIIGIATNNRAIRDAFMGCLSAYGATSVVRSFVAYSLVARTRPDSARDPANASPPAREGDQYQIDLGHGGWGRNSFPAGHTANMAACASFISHRFESRYAAAAAYTFAAAVGVGRLADRRHWTSDTIVGWVFGYAAGKLVADRTLRRERDATPTAAGSGGAAAGSPVAPARGIFVTPDAHGVAFGWQFTF